MQHLLKVRDQSIQNQHQEIAVGALTQNNDQLNCAILLYLSCYTTSSHCLILSMHYRLCISTVVEEHLSFFHYTCTELQGGGKEAAATDPGFGEGAGPLREGCC